MADSIVHAAAESLAAHLKRAKTPVNVDAIVSILSVCYYASMQLEEQRTTVVSIAYVNPAKPDPHRPPRIRPQRWTVHPLTDAVELSVRNLVKIAPSASPSCTLVAVYWKREGPFMWGLVDQQVAYRRAMDFEGETRFRRPGLFQVEILGPGVLQIFDDDAHVVTIRGDGLIRHYPDVLESGPVARILEPYVRSLEAAAFDAFVSRVRFRYDVARVRRVIRSAAREAWTGALRQVLLRVQRRKHGGAIVLLPRRKWTFLKPKYTLNYARVEAILAARVAAEVEKLEASVIVSNTVGQTAESSVPRDLFYGRVVAEGNRQDSVEAEVGAVAFIASLTAVDGAVVLHTGISVQGFGVEITRKAEPSSVYVATTALPRKRLSRANPTDFGTRHRSMMRFCAASPGAVGFVVSQDGDIRCLALVGRRLTMWDNIKTHGFVSPEGRRRSPA